MCVLSSKLLFGGTDWIENWRRGDKHKLGFLPKKNKDMGHLQNLLLTATYGGITCGDDYNLRIIHPFSAKYSFSLLRQISNGLCFLAMVKDDASFRRIPERQKAYPKRLCNYGFALFVVLFSNTDEMKSFEWWKVLKVHSLLSILSSWLAGCLFGQATILWHFLMKIFFVLS